MNIVAMPEVKNAASNLRKMTFEEIWKTAEKYGEVTVYGNRERPMPERYSCTIVFDTSPGTSVEANSGFGLTVHEALCRATERAMDIVSSFKDLG